MVTPQPNLRIAVEGSTLVSSAMYDDAAERIFVWEHSGRRWVFENCTEDEWASLMSPATSRGEYVMNVLRSHPHRILRH